MTKCRAFALVLLPYLLCGQVDCFKIQGTPTVAAGSVSVDVKNECSESAAMWSFVCRNPEFTSPLVRNEDSTISEGFHPGFG